MLRQNRCCAVVFAAALSVTAGSSWAETVELVTYYPSSAAAGDLHVRSLTVGTDYEGVTPANGQAFIFDRLGIGPDFTAAAPPTQALEVEGNALLNSPATALFMADRAATTNYSGLQLLTNGALKWTIGSRNDGTEHLHLFSDADNATRLFIQQGTGNIGINTTDPALASLSFGSSQNNGRNQFDSTSTGVGIRNDVLDIWSNPPANQKLGLGVHSGALEIYATSGNSIMLGERSMSAAGLFTPRMTVHLGGNVGIGTTTPQPAPAPNGQSTGNIDANDVWLRGANGGAGGWASQSSAAPDYDSGWVADNNSSDHITAFTHNLGAIPRQVVAWFSPTSGNPAKVFPVILGQEYGVYRNPSHVEYTATQVLFSIWSGAPLGRSWYPVTGWTNYNSGYWRVFCWR